MYLDWMGEYRDVIEAMIGMANVYTQVHNRKVFSGSVKLTPVELQVIEYILENEERNENMSEIAQRLSISQSSFSKKVKDLVSRGLLEKYYAANNRKNVIIKVSGLGKEFYMAYSTGSQTDVWRKIFSRLDKLDKKTIQIFIDSLNEFRNELQSYLEGEKPVTNSNVDLIKIE